MANYRIGIIGVGGIAGLHARSVHDLDNVQIVGATCRTEDKGQKFVAEHGGTWYDNYETMLDQQKPDVAIVTTPSGKHLEPTLACAERGVHVLCEKPLEITTQRIDQMLAKVKEAGISLGGVFPMRYNPAVSAVYDAAHEGRFGPLGAAGGYVPWWRDDAYYAPERWQGTLALDGGGAFMNQAIHTVDLVQWLAAAALGQDHESNPVSEVFAYAAKRGRDPNLIEVEDTGAALLKFKGGPLGQLLATTSMYPGTLRRVLLGGRGGTAEVQEDKLLNFQFAEDRDGDEQIRQQFSEARDTEGGASDPLALDYLNHRRNIEAFLAALEGKARSQITGPQARVAVAIIEAIYESVRTGKPAVPK